MKAVVIGATGHIGTYLVPQLAEAGYEVTAVTRSASRPYEHHPAWDAAQRLLLDRSQAGFARAIADPTEPVPTGEDNRRALEIALACIRSVEENRPVEVAEVNR